jgi:hypothetical protein
MFYNVHHHYLKTFKKYQTFEQLMLNGNYNCLTGTALYALILEELGYKYDIIETTYHIFIIVKTQTGRFLIESTDPFSGFEYNDDIINERLQAIRDSELKRHNKSVYNYKVSLFKNVGLMDLVGLQFYNQAINAFNNKEFINAAVYLDQASNYYRSERYLEFFQLIVANIIKDPELYREFSKNYRYMNILATL